MLKLYIRQGFTETGKGNKEVIQGVYDIITSYKDQFALAFCFPPKALDKDSFREYFATKTGGEFKPQGFRKYRLSLLDEADAFIVIRTSLSESTSFEISYNIYGSKNIPMFFAVWEEAPIKTTLLKDLEDVADVEYYKFKSANELKEPIFDFLKRVGRS